MTLRKRTPRGRFVYQKLNKIRWKPVVSQSGRIAGSLFLTGSWDDEENTVKLWSWNANDDENQKNSVDESTEPELKATYKHNRGDVNEIQFINPDIAICASSDGTVTALKIGREFTSAPSKELETASGWALQEIGKWDKFHSMQFTDASCNSVACSSENFATVGEDGKINLANIKRQEAIRSYETADSCSLNAVIFMRNDEIAAANMRGQLKIWDLRSKDQEPTRTCVLSSEQISIGCIAKHPTQQHILCSGSEDGMLAFWDLRSQVHPVTLLNAHEQSVSEIQFHQQQPDHMFSCSQNGDIWHWNGSNIAKKSSNALNFGNQMTPNLENVHTLDTACPWLNSEAVKNRVETQSLMTRQPLPVNSIDVLGDSILVGADNEAMYLINNVLY